MPEPLFASLFDETVRRPLTVSELTESVRKAIEARFSSVWVEGEISNFKAHSSGHWYFTIKDEGAQIRAKCFRSANGRIRFRPKDGLHVRARGRLTVYEVRGEYELIVEALDPVGAGALQLAFEQLRDRLQAEGLFAAELKRPLPFFPGRVGVVTSPTGAAIRDILNVIARRTRTVHVLFSPARVQGDGAGGDIARAIKLLNVHHQRALNEGRTADLVDVLIVGRGGGSTEDLWAFNEEEVARAIRASAIPVISAVGHETDFTIADFVSDRRAATPSAAAELVAAREDQLCETLAQTGQALSRMMRYKIVIARSLVQQHALSQAFDEVRGRLRDAAATTNAASHRLQMIMNQTVRAAHLRAEALNASLAPAQLRARFTEARVRFDSAYTGCHTALEKQFAEAKKRLGLAAASLDALSPLAVLQRGYAIAQQEDGQLLRDATTVAPGDSIKVRLAHGKITARVERIEDN
ncbi:MAG: exodeoxyribonuclease large subunit [Pyrinomonadaceae bacterium]|jgi:exodeoxyribonuclease VII large subunit|nr:exodeoxyribonuclease large subunit [Pyrinomonadaceae bacterium]